MRALSHVITAFLALFALLGGFACVTHAAPIEATFLHLGLPRSLATLVGAWKLLGAVALLIPGAPRLREQALIGFLYLYSGAVVIHLAAGDGLAGALAPITLLLLAVARLALEVSLRRTP